MIGQWVVLAAALLAAGSVVAAPFARRIPTIGDRRIDTALLVGAIVALWVAVARLAVALLDQDTTIAYVVDQTRPGSGVATRLSGLWSGAEGSLLLFAAIIATALVVGHRDGPGWQRAGVGIVVAGLALAAALAADPFATLDLPPLAGAGMAPILEHWAMIVHPPLLYAGLALAVVPGLVRPRQRARRWSILAFTVLTVALAIGSAWAYVELGWGGWWAWDPIENVALVVWLLLAAGLHWPPADRRSAANLGPGPELAWALCWPAVLAGAALTRTSLRTSVHAFADASQLSRWLWPLVVLAGIGAGLRLREADRAVAAGATSDSAASSDSGPTATSAPTGGRRPVRLDRALRRLGPPFVMATAAGIVAAGTYRPFVGGDGTAGWFYSRTLYPLAVAGAVLAGLLPYRRRPSLPVAAAGTVAGLAVAVVSGWTGPAQLLLAAAIGTGLSLTAGGLRGRRKPGRVTASVVARVAAHVGMLLILFGALAGTGSSGSVVRLTDGELATVDGHEVLLIGTAIVGSDPLEVEAVVEVDGHRMDPSVAVFPERRLRLPEVATMTRPWRDVQVVLRDVDETEGALLTVLVRPGNQLVWWGAGLIVFAGLVLLITGMAAGRRTDGPADQRRSRLARSSSSIDVAFSGTASGSGGGTGTDGGSEPGAGPG